MEAAGERLRQRLAARDERRGVARGDRGEHGEPERAAELARGVDEPRGQPRLARGRRRSRRRSSPARTRSRGPSAVTTPGHEDVADVAAVGARRTRSRSIPTRRRAPSRPRARGRAPTRLDQRGPRASRRAMIATVIGRNASAGLDRRVAEHLLQVERDEVPHGEHARSRGRTRRRSPPSAIRERTSPSGTSGRARPAALDHEEQAEQREADGHRRRASRPSPSRATSVRTIPKVSAMRPAVTVTAPATS